MVYEKSKETISNILATAQALFVEKNYGNVTIAKIAEHAGVSTGALYHHFSSKEEIYLEMMHYYLGEIRETMQAADDSNARTCREQLFQFTISFLELPEDQRRVLGLVRRDINIFPDPMRNELIRAYQAVIPEPLEEIIREGIKTGEIKPFDARILSWELVAMVEVATNEYSRKTIGDDKKVVEFVLELFLNGGSA